MTLYSAHADSATRLSCQPRNDRPVRCPVQHGRARSPCPRHASPAPHCHAERDLRAAPAARRVRAAAGARLPARASACGASPQGRTHKMTVQISPSGSRFVKVIPAPVRRRSPRNACTWVENSPRPEHGYIIVSRAPLARPHQKSGKLRLWPPRNGHMGVGRRGRKHSAPRLSWLVGRENRALISHRSWK